MLRLLPARLPLLAARWTAVEPEPATRTAERLRAEPSRAMSGFHMYPPPAIPMDRMLRDLHETMRLPGERQARFTFRGAHRPTRPNRPRQAAPGARPNPAVQEVQRPTWSRQAAPGARPNPAEKIHFIDRYREGIISGVGKLEPILDRLYSQNLLTLEKYQTVQAEKIPQDQMRKLYKYMHSWCETDKEKFFDALLEFENPLMRKLLKE